MGVTVFVEEGLDSHLQSITEYLENTSLPSYWIECGGYLPLVWDKISPNARTRIQGAVEDTERGLRNYKRLEGKLPIFDVARSLCKRFEDAIVGDSVIHSIAHVLRTSDLPLVGMQAVVIGFGKIGQSCARSLDGYRCQVRVHDMDAHKVLEAFNLGYQIEEREKVFTHCQLIVGATGENSLRREDLPLLEDKTILASASSRQIEFFDLIEAADEVNKIAENLSVYRYIKENKSLLVVNNGFPANFIHGSSMGSRIDLVLASLVAAYIHLLDSKDGNFEKIIQLPFDQQQDLANGWLKIWNYGKDCSLNPYK